eukprot:11585898-Alexandrium_andersonii.AAC.1
MSSWCHQAPTRWGKQCETTARRDLRRGAPVIMPAVSASKASEWTHPPQAVRGQNLSSMFRMLLRPVDSASCFLGFQLAE